MNFSVSDTGCGMTDDMKGLFHPFERESASTAMKHGGSGLGLSVKNLVEMMQGTYQCGKRERQRVYVPCGSSFWLVRAGPADNNEKLKSIRALIVDDERL